jgi:diguanylate cyclase (GGDEF)-like protein
MELRQTLLSFFVGLIVLTLLVFGYSAYEIARQSSRETEGELLSLLNHERSQAIAEAYRAGATVDTLARTLHIEQSDIPMLRLLVDGHGRVVAESSTLRSRTPPVSSAFAQATQATRARKGKIRLDQRDWTFASVAVANSPYTLISISPRGYSDRNTLSRLASRLGVTGLIIAWVAVWIALVISTAVARRLRAQTDRLRYQATHDSLTDLPNRVSLLESLANAIDRARQERRSVALILMDLDRFKDINDTLGHATGDLLLQKVADSLRVNLWDGDRVARLGGDEFGMVLPMANSADTQLVVGKLRSILADPFDVNELSLRADASIGVALFPDHGDDAGSLMRNAEIAMYMAKSRRDPFEIYNPEQDPFSLERLRLTADISHALSGNELFMVYQPKMDFVTGMCAGAEALLRWRHPAHGLVPPDQFIPLAEQTSNIRDITFWTLDATIGQCREWIDQGEQIAVAVNLSASMLHDSTLPERIRALLEKHEVPADLLQLEITETAIMLDPDGALETLEALDRLGLHLSIDDFGTGYTSLSHLKRLPVDEIKIDKSFVMNMSENENDASIVNALIDLAHEMRLRVVAEGVESEAILDALAAKGCDQSQGYFHTRPLPAHELVTWLAGGPCGATKATTARA